MLLLLSRYNYHVITRYQDIIIMLLLLSRYNYQDVIIMLLLLSRYNYHVLLLSRYITVIKI